MIDAPTCPTCHEPIYLNEAAYFWPDHQTMEHLWCRVHWVVDVYADVEASADPAYGPMS